MIGLVCLVLMSFFLVGCDTEAAGDSGDDAPRYLKANPQRAPILPRSTGHEDVCY